MPHDILYIGFVLGHGGDAFQMLDLAAGMAEFGKSVRIIVPDIPTTAEFAMHCSSRGVDLVRSPLIRADPVAPRQVPEDLARLFTENPASILHLHTGDFCLSRTIPRVMGELGIPPEKVIVTVHSPYDTLTPGDERSTAWAQAAGNRIRTIACPSRHSLQTQLKYGVAAHNLVHIPNGVAIDRYRSGNGARIRGELNLGANDDLVVFTSRLDEQKHPQDALEGFRRIAAEHPSAHLAFVGSGTLHCVLQAQSRAAGISNRVHFVGQRSDIPDWLAAATVWVLPTERENFSLAILEALAAGCPILSTRCKGNDEVLVPGVNAETHAIGDLSEIASKLRLLLSNPAYRAKLSEGAKSTSLEYSSERMVHRYQTVCDEMLMGCQPLLPGENREPF